MTEIPAALPALVEGFFTGRLMRQLRASPHTVASYRDTFRLLFLFAERRLGRTPSALSLADLDAPFVVDFLEVPVQGGEAAEGAAAAAGRLASISTVRGSANATAL